MENYNSTQAKRALTVNDPKEAYFWLDINESPGYDDISFNVVRNCFDSLLKLLMAIFNLSLQKGCFPGEFETASVISVFKADDVNKLGNYRPISALPCFSKIWERIMYNWLFKYQIKYFIKNDLDFKKDILRNTE